MVSVVCSAPLMRAPEGPLRAAGARSGWPIRSVGPLGGPVPSLGAKLAMDMLQELASAVSGARDRDAELLDKAVAAGSLVEAEMCGSGTHELLQQIRGATLPAGTGLDAHEAPAFKDMVPASLRRFLTEPSEASPWKACHCGSHAQGAGPCVFRAWVSKRTRIWIEKAAKHVAKQAAKAAGQRRQKGAEGLAFARRRCKLKGRARRVRKRAQRVAPGQKGRGSGRKHTSWNNSRQPSENEGGAESEARAQGSSHLV